jgi:hypothetical protein
MRAFKDVNDGFGWILTCVDHFSGYALAHPMEYKEAQEVAECLAETFKWLGVWQIVHADNGGEFNNDLVHSLEEMLNIKSIHGSILTLGARKS